MPTLTNICIIVNENLIYKFVHFLFTSRIFTSISFLSSISEINIKHIYIAIGLCRLQVRTYATFVFCRFPLALFSITGMTPLFNVHPYLQYWMNKIWHPTKYNIMKYLHLSLYLHNKQTNVLHEYTFKNCAFLFTIPINVINV